MRAHDCAAVVGKDRAILTQRPNVAARRWRARSEYIPVSSARGSDRETARCGASNVRTLLADAYQRSTQPCRSRLQKTRSQPARVRSSDAVPSNSAKLLPRQRFGLLLRVVRAAADGWSPAREACEDRLEARRRERASRDAFTACPRGPAVAGDRPAAVEDGRIRVLDGDAVLGGVQRG